MLTARVLIVPISHIHGRCAISSLLLKQPKLAICAMSLQTSFCRWIWVCIVQRLMMPDHCVSSVKNNKMTCGEGAVPMLWLVNTLCYYFTCVVFERTSRSVYQNSCSTQV